MKISKMPKMFTKPSKMMMDKVKMGPKVRHMMDDAVTEGCHGAAMFDHRKEARERGE